LSAAALCGRRLRGRRGGADDKPLLRAGEGQGDDAADEEAL
jgi:hypothetical protein